MDFSFPGQQSTTFQNCFYAIDQMLGKDSDFPGKNIVYPGYLWCHQAIIYIPNSPLQHGPFIQSNITKTRNTAPGKSITKLPFSDRAKCINRFKTGDMTFFILELAGR